MEARLSAGMRGGRRSSEGSVLASMTVDDGSTVGDLIWTLNQTDVGLGATLKDDGTIELESISNRLSISGLGADDLSFAQAVEPSWLTAMRRVK